MDREGAPRPRVGGGSLRDRPRERLRARLRRGETSPAAEAEQAPHPKIDTTVAQSARVWNYWLGGQDNYAVDRAMGDQVESQFPSIVALARASRAFQIRAVRYLAGEAEIRQFLDVGTGLPTANNTHEVAQSVAPESRIVYVESDPLVLVHARALLVSKPLGATDYIDADARGTETILREACTTSAAWRAGRSDPQTSARRCPICGVEPSVATAERLLAGGKAALIISSAP